MTTSTAESPRKIKVPALIIAVLSVVTTRLAGVETSAIEYSRQKAEALALFENSGADLGSREQLDDADINECMREIRDKRWTDLDWFANIPVGGGLVTVEAENNEGEASADEDGTNGTVIPSKRSMDDLRGSDNDYLQAGLGTMVDLSRSLEMSTNFVLDVR